MSSYEQRKQAAIHFRKETERRINDALQRYSSWLNSKNMRLEFPIDIDRMIEQWLGLGLYIGSIRDEFKRDEVENLRDVWGALFYDADFGGWMIFIDEELEQSYREGPLRFTQAHEVVHYLCHIPEAERDPSSQPGLFGAEEMAKTYNRIFCRKGEENSYKEREADYGAACLLAPADEVIRRFDSWAKEADCGAGRITPGNVLHADAIDTLREQFGLSRKAMEIRLDELGLTESADQQLL